jgi:hypothetical protein
MDKTRFHNLDLRTCTMSLMGFLFAPRKDHKGWSTPSEAARLYFLLVLFGTAIWAWPLTQGRILLWLGLIVFVATPLLTVGWWLISLVSQRFESRVLVDSLNRIDRSKKESIHSFRKP